jgi:hypothetical protein
MRCGFVRSFISYNSSFILYLSVSIGCDLRVKLFLPSKFIIQLSPFPLPAGGNFRYSFPNIRLAQRENSCHHGTDQF